MSRIIVKNLPDQITKEKLKQIFSEKGIITDIQLKFTKNGKFRKFAFIGFQKSEMAEAAKEYLNKSFINTSKIQIEICAELGDPNKPRPWSKYAPENLKSINEKIQENKNKEANFKKLSKSKIKDSQISELIKNHKNDKLFTEFLEVNVPDLPNDLKLNEMDLDNEMDENKKVVADEEEELENDKNILANKDISDSEYIKLKTGVNLNLTDVSLETKTLDKKIVKYRELFTVKLSGLPLKVKKSQIKEFLSPVKPYTIRRALKIRGIAYCGFLTEKEMKVAVLKNRSFLNNKRIFVTVLKKKKNDEETKTKWKNEVERLNGIESVAESGKIFARNLPYTATEEDLREKFEKYGPITELLMPIDSFTRKPKGFAFVTFLMPEHACRAFNELDGTIFQGRMLHLLPSLPKNNEEDISSDDAFKKNKLKKEKAKSASSMNWNTFFIGENALSEAMAAQYNTTKENVLNDKEGGAAVRLALGETQFINKMKQFLEENDVCLEAFENMSICPRSKTVILVKNLPFGTKSEEIREKFVQFGVLKRVVLPPTGVAALVEFIEPSEAKVAFRRISYSKFKHLPMYLEWAPEEVFKNKDKMIKPKSEEEESEKVKQLEEKKTEHNEEQPEKNAETTKDHIPVDGATIFVKNLNFSTENEGLRQHFSSCGSIISATVALKKNPNIPGKKLSMGYGFVEFADKESADKALKTLQFSSLDNHRIELKRSNRTLATSFVNERRTPKRNEKPSSKILVRNVPFQATQKEISDLFKVFGEIKAVRLPKKMVGTGSHRGFCFIEYNTVQDAKRAFGALSQSTHLYGRRLVLEWAAANDDVATLREKTAQQFKTGTAGIMNKTKNVTIEDDLGETNSDYLF